VAHLPAFYRRRLGGDSARLRLTELPVLRRADVPELAGSVRELDPQRATRFASSRTSGSTGMPVDFFYSVRHQASRFAARARYLLDNGWSPFERSAWIVSMGIQSPDGMFTRRGRWLGARFITHITDFERLVEWLCEIDPVHLYAYPVNLDGLARAFESGAPRPRSLRRIFSGSEVLEDSLRDRLRRIFGLEVADNYGSTEAFLAWQCPQGSYHANAEHVILEIVDEDGRATPPGAMGRVLVTTLHNEVMPLIRYEIGDYAIAAAGACDCGRTLPVIGRIVGREINLFVARDGRRFVPWPLFKPLIDAEWITQHQIVQRGVDRFLVRFVGTRPITPEDEAAIRSHFETRLQGPVTVELEPVDRIARAPSGKFMMALNEIG
jgi:phenylacetate-CoA ligase